MKRLLFFFIPFLAYGTIQQGPLEVSTQKPVIAFDVDDVLIYRSPWKNIYTWLRILWKAPHRLATMKCMIWLLTQYLTPESALNQHIKNIDAEGFIDWLIPQWPILKEKTAQGQEFHELIRHTIAQATPNEPIISLMKTLRKEGYPIAIATNQGSRTFERIVNQGILPNSGYIAVVTADNKKHTKYLKKPSVRYFTRLRNKVIKAGFDPDTIILIDDKIENIEGAKKINIRGIHFQSAPQLKKDLNLLISQPQ